ncbi:hypothetical protein EDB87DRAFT_786317 [Lactarius vividus]|nr:hypothetical protein EDB87DRAFT_786317 [Lactarius vividus]
MHTEIISETSSSTKSLRKERSSWRSWFSELGSDASPSDTQSRVSQSEILGSARSSLQSFYTANTSLSQSSTTPPVYRNSTASSNLSFPYTVTSINSYKSRKNVLYPRRAHPPPVMVSPEYATTPPDLIWDVRYLCATLLPHAETRLVPAATVLLRCLPVGPQGDPLQGPPNINDDSLRCSEFFLVLTREIFLRGAAGAKELEGPCELLHETFRDILFKSGVFVPRSTSNLNAIDLRVSLAEAEDFERVIRVLRALCSVMDDFECRSSSRTPAQVLTNVIDIRDNNGPISQRIGPEAFSDAGTFEWILMAI